MSQRLLSVLAVSTRVIEAVLLISGHPLLSGHLAKSRKFRNLNSVKITGRGHSFVQSRNKYFIVLNLY